MDLRKLKKLIDLVEESGIAELEITEGEEKVRISRSTTHAQPGPAVLTQAVAAAPELPGATDLLRRLAPMIELHVCSNTPEDTVRRHVAARGWNPYLEGVDGYPTTKAGRIAAVIAARGLAPSRVAMVGDGISDEEAAAANGCVFFAIRAPEDLMRAGQLLEDTHV